SPASRASQGSPGWRRVTDLLRHRSTYIGRRRQPRAPVGPRTAASGQVARSGDVLAGGRSTTHAHTLFLPHFLPVEHGRPGLGAGLRARGVMARITGRGPEGGRDPDRDPDPRTRPGPRPVGRYGAPAGVRVRGS